MSVKPSGLRLVRAGTADQADAFAALQVATPSGRLRRIDLTERQALELASTLLLIAAEHAHRRAAEPQHEAATSGNAAERGRQLANEREELIARGIDPSTLAVPIHPDDADNQGDDQ